MKKRRVVKTRKPRKELIMLFSFIILSISAYLLYTIVMEVTRTIELQNKLELVQAELDVITDQNRKLSSQVDKLENPDYVQNYARGKYMLSKQGEDIYYLPGELDNMNDDSSNTSIMDETTTQTDTNNTEEPTTSTNNDE